MYINVLQVLLLGFIINHTHVTAKEKVHIKIHVPEFIKHHHHTKIVFIKKKGHGHGGGGHGHDDKKKVHVVIHKHDHSHKHKHDHGHKHGHKHAGKHDHKHDHKGQHKHTHVVHKGHKHHDHHHKKKHDDHHHKKKKHDDHHHHFLPEDYSRTSHRSELYNYETIRDSHSPNPFVLTSSYQVKEKNPEDYTTQEYHEQYQYPPLSTVNDKYTQLLGYGDEKEEENDPSGEYQDYQESVVGLEDPKNFLDYDYSSPTETKSFQEYRDTSTDGYHPFSIDSPGLDQYLNREYGDASHISERKIKAPISSTTTVSYINKNRDDKKKIKKKTTTMAATTTTVPVKN